MNVRLLTSSIRYNQISVVRNEDNLFSVGCGRGAPLGFFFCVSTLHLNN